jgi:hypothetical protein
MPGRLKKPPPGRDAVLDDPMPGLVCPADGVEGCVMVRSIGRAAFGAVRVEGGAEKVREPREPDEEPPPTRASASANVSASGMASARKTASVFVARRANDGLAIFDLALECNGWWRKD